MKICIRKKNILVMFLVIMMSFAIISEVSAIDDAEPDGTGMNVFIDSHNNQQRAFSPGESTNEMSNNHVQADDSIDDSYPNNEQTSFRQSPVKGDQNIENKNLYEQKIDDQKSDVNYPVNAPDKNTQNNFDNQMSKPINDEIGNQKQMDNYQRQNGVNMINSARFDNNMMPENIRFDGATAPIHFNHENGSEVSNEVMSKLLGLNQIANNIQPINNKNHFEGNAPIFGENLPLIIFDLNRSLPNFINNTLPLFDGDRDLPVFDNMSLPLFDGDRDLPQFNNSIPKPMFDEMNSMLPQFDNHRFGNNTNSDFNMVQFDDKNLPKLFNITDNVPKNDYINSTGDEINFRPFDETLNNSTIEKFDLKH